MGWEHPNMPIKDKMATNDSSIGVSFPTLLTLTICWAVANGEASSVEREPVRFISIDGVGFSNKYDKP